MQSIDYDYIGTITGSLFGIPTRIYKNNTLIFYHSTVNLVKDPVSIYQADILKITDHVGYFMTARIRLIMAMEISSNFKPFHPFKLTPFTLPYPLPCQLTARNGKHC